MNINFKANIVSLKTSNRRRARIKKMCQSLGIEYTFFDAVDGNNKADVNSLFYCDESLPRIYVKRSVPISSREIACAISHMQTIFQGYKAGYDYLLIMEDDVDILCFGNKLSDQIFNSIPQDASYVQLQALGAKTVAHLFDFYKNTGNIFARKANHPPIKFIHSDLADINCHGAAAYLLTRAGMATAYKNYFAGDKVIFPCSRDEVISNVGLVADRFIYQATSSDNHPGYACCLPVFTIEAQDSLLHPGHVPLHLDARQMAIKIYNTIIGDNKS